MTDSELKKELERIIRYHKTPDGHVTVHRLQPKLKELVRFIRANFDVKDSN